VFHHLADEARLAIARAGIEFAPGVGHTDLLNGRAKLVTHGTRTFAVPVLAGGDDVGVMEALDHVTKQLDEINAAASKGETVDESEKEKLEGQKNALEQVAASSADGPREGESEVEFLRRYKRENEERSEAKQIVTEALRAYQERESGKSERIAQYALEALKDAGLDLEAGGLDGAVERIIKNHREPSRFVGSQAEKDTAAEIAAGRAAAADATGHLSIGNDRGIKALEESSEKYPLGTYISLLNKRKFGLPSQTELRYFENLYGKALAEGTPSAGGVLVPREYMDDLLGLLRAQTVVRRAQPRFTRFKKEMYQTSVSTGATAFYTQENAQIPMSEPSFAEAALLTPKNLTALVPVSNYLLNDAEETEEFVRQDLAEVMALREDLAFLRGSGAAGEPRGFRNIVGVTLDPFAPGAGGVRFSLAQLRRIRATFRSLNAGSVRPVWFFNPEFLTYLETLEEMSGGSPTGRTLLDAETIQYDDDTMTSGRFDGVRFYSTTQLPNGTTGGNPTTELYLVNMAEAIVGENQELEVDISREASYWDGGAWISAFQNNQSVFRAVMRHDIAHRRPAQIVVQTGARTT